jgi:hypothetical protein
MASSSEAVTRTSIALSELIRSAPPVLAASSKRSPSQARRVHMAERMEGIDLIWA